MILINEKTTQTLLPYLGTVDLVSY